MEMFDEIDCGESLSLKSSAMDEMILPCSLVVGTAC